MLVGDDGQDKNDSGEVVTPWAMEMTLWDTVTNEMTTVPHPPGYDDHDTLRFVFKRSLITHFSKIYFTLRAS